MFRMTVQMAIRENPNRLLQLKKEIELPFVPVVGMALEFESVPTTVEEVGYFVGQGDFYVGVAPPASMYDYDFDTKKSHKVTVKEMVKRMVEEDGFTLDVTEFARKPKRKGRSR
jgi:hypothetical protein